MKFIKLVLTNGSEIEINRDLIKAIVPKEDGPKVHDRLDRLFQLDLVGGNPPLEFKGPDGTIQMAIDENELRMRMLPAVTAALLQSPLLNAIINNGDGKILGAKIVEEAREIVGHMVAREVYGAELGENANTIFGGRIKIKKEEADAVQRSGAPETGASPVVSETPGTTPSETAGSPSNRSGNEGTPPH